MAQHLPVAQFHGQLASRQLATQQRVEARRRRLGTCGRVPQVCSPRHDAGRAVTACPRLPAIARPPEPPCEGSPPHEGRAAGNPRGSVRCLLTQPQVGFLQPSPSSPAVRDEIGHAGSHGRAGTRAGEGSV